MSAPAASAAGAADDARSIQIQQIMESADIEVVRSKLRDYCAAHGLRRGWHSEEAKKHHPVIVLSYLDDNLDGMMLSFLASFTDEHSTPDARSRSILYYRARNHPFQALQGDPRVCEALVIVGHGSAGSSSLSSRAEGGTSYSFDTIRSHLLHFRPRLITLLTCEGGNKQAGSLMNTLAQQAVPIFGAEAAASLILVSNTTTLFAHTVMLDIVGIFLFQLWVYLTQDGVYGLRIKQHVENMDNRMRVAPGRFTDAHGQHVSLSECHLLVIACYQLFKRPITELRQYPQLAHIPSDPVHDWFVSRPHPQQSNGAGVSVLLPTTIDSIGEFFWHQREHQKHEGLPIVYDPARDGPSTVVSPEHVCHAAPDLHQRTVSELQHAQIVSFRHAEDGSREIFFHASKQVIPWSGKPDEQNQSVLRNFLHQQAASASASNTMDWDTATSMEFGKRTKH